MATYRVTVTAPRTDGMDQPPAPTPTQNGISIESDGSALVRAASLSEAAVTGATALILWHGYDLRMCGHDPCLWRGSVHRIPGSVCDGAGDFTVSAHNIWTYEDVQIGTQFHVEYVGGNFPF